MLHTKEPHYLLLKEAFFCSDFDEWLGIYHDDEMLRTAYEQAATLLAEKTEKYPPGYYQIAIYEFSPTNGNQQITFDFEWHFGLHGQEFRPVKPEELECFKKQC